MEMAAGTTLTATAAQQVLWRQDRNKLAGTISEAPTGEKCHLHFKEMCSLNFNFNL